MHTRIATAADCDSIVSFYQQLQEATRRLYAPHPMDRETILQQIADPAYLMLLSFVDDELAGYQVFLKGAFTWERDRYQQYGIVLDQHTASYAPVLGDGFQGRGLGVTMLEQALPILKAARITQLILWGGVQCANIRAVNFYLKNGFRIVGYFEWEGANYDMISTIDGSHNRPASL
ncbi:MAG: GNAT family N-acetyltransferase [Flavipsychrobacter sp.]|nr:GNAT family N-acetyltransferase [Flavipsychrobacter sp.]